jgi:hypothetical protein
MKIRIIPAECPYIGCNFTSSKHGIKSKNDVIAHIEKEHN